MIVAPYTVLDRFGLGFKLWRMKTRQLGIQKSVWGLVLAVGSILPASAHFVYDTAEGAAHNLEHLAPSLSLIVLLLALGAMTAYCLKRKQ